MKAKLVQYIGLILIWAMGFVAGGVAFAADEEAQEGFKASITCYAASIVSGESSPEETNWWAVMLLSLDPKQFNKQDTVVKMNEAVDRLFAFIETEPDGKVALDKAATACNNIRSKIIANESEPR